MLSVFEHISATTASWLLSIMTLILDLSITVGLIPAQSRGQLLPQEARFLSLIPRTIKTAIGWLEIDPALIRMNCCKACFALYLLTRTPRQCSHRIAQIPGGLLNLEDSEQMSPSADLGPRLDFEEKTCGELLLKMYRGKEIPVRCYAFQSLSGWIHCQHLSLGCQNPSILRILHPS